MTQPEGTGKAAAPPVGDATRVVDAQRQAKRTLVVAAVFAVSALVSLFLPHLTGRWLPLHLMMLGAVFTVILAVTLLLAVQWSASPCPRPRWWATVRWSMVAGVYTAVFGRELSLPWMVDLGGMFLAVVILTQSLMLLQVRRQGVVHRYRPAIDGYLMALWCASFGVFLGPVINRGHPAGHYIDGRQAHFLLNLLGLIGVVIAATLPYFIATQARLKMSKRVTPTRLRAGPAVMTVAASVAGGLLYAGLRRPAGVAVLVYAAALLWIVFLLPDLGAKQFRWAGPRLVMLLTGVGWWFATAVVWGGFDVAGRSLDLWPVLLGLACGYLQIVHSSLAYLVPVLRAGGHKRLTAGFAAWGGWSGWLALAAANVCSVAVLGGWWTAATVGGAVWVASALLSLARFVYRPPAPA